MECASLWDSLSRFDVQCANPAELAVEPAGVADDAAAKESHKGPGCGAALASAGHDQAHFNGWGSPLRKDVDKTGPLDFRTRPVVGERRNARPVHDHPRN